MNAKGERELAHLTSRATLTHKHTYSCQLALFKQRLWEMETHIFTSFYLYDNIHMYIYQAEKLYMYLAHVHIVCLLASASKSYTSRLVYFILCALFAVVALVCVLNGVSVFIMHFSTFIWIFIYIYKHIYIRVEEKKIIFFVFLKYQ